MDASILSTRCSAEVDPTTVRMACSVREDCQDVKIDRDVQQEKEEEDEVDEEEEREKMGEYDEGQTKDHEAWDHRKAKKV